MAYSKQSNKNEPIKKHSGCQHHTHFFDKKTGEQIDMNFITAWNYSKSRGLLTIIASPRKDPSKRKTANPKFENWACKVFFKRTLQTVWYNGFFDLAKKKLTIKDMEFVLNPKAKNGGYCGTFVKS
ncbi:hypothetical protein [Flavobacterium franklandianum]|uniref:Uncharacterized protein n=1 Tax=Flavobacterium franklandianum TaxID=2594430 RepID=A0A553C8A5_9FLAO|nr:hypothetical protein [Flavobacterium franklandianum]TRX16736.1 hypothetical protein FNW17_12295 [Flavobacterium franklandianum]